MPLRFVDGQERPLRRSKDASSNEQSVPFAIRKFRGTVRRARILAGRHSFISLNTDPYRDVGLLKEFIDDGHRRFSTSCMLKAHLVSCVICCRYGARTDIFSINELVYGHTSPLGGILIPVSRLRILVYIANVLLSLDLGGCGHVQSVGLHPRLPVG